MPLSHVSCLLCGGAIDESGNLPDWMSQFRALYTILQQWHSVYMSGVSERKSFFDFIPVDHPITQASKLLKLENPIRTGGLTKISLTPTHLGGLDLPRLPLTSLHLWGFALHPSCWNLLVMNCPRVRSDPAACIQALFDLCRSQPVYQGTIDWGHDYGGLFCRKPESDELMPGEESDLESTQLLNMLWAYDPFRIPQLTDQIQNPSTFRGTQPGYHRPSNDQVSAIGDVDPFFCLPIELATEILTLLPSKDVANLRLASKRFAILPLVDYFWRSRFHTGKDFPYLFEYSLCKNISGRELFDKAKSIKDLPAVRNRQRVWSLASYLTSLIESRLESPRCEGTPCESFFEPSVSPDEGKWLTAQGTISAPKEGLIHKNGARMLYDRTLSLGELDTAGWVSSISIGGRSYITGLRLTQKGGGVLQLGYRWPRQETKILWPDDTPQVVSLSGIEVALDSRGIRALRYLASCGRYSSWVGEHEGIPKTRLVATNPDGQPSGPLKTLKGGFDALKLISLSVNIDKFGATHIMHRDGNHEKSRVWYPQIPADKLEFLASEVSRFGLRNVFAPLSTCLFGGNDGELLSHITQVTLWTVLSPEPVLGENRLPWGIAFHYDQEFDDCETKALGLIPQTEDHATQAHSFQINSSEGERITRIDVHYLNVGYPAAFTFHTNQMRKIQIPRDSLEEYSPGDYLTDNLLPKDGGVITGICSALRRHTVLQNPGILCVANPENVD